MTGFDDNAAVMGEWVTRSPSRITLFTDVLVEEKSSKPVLERELSLNHGQLGSENVEKKEGSRIQLAEEKPSSRGGGLGERIAARAGFNSLKLNTESVRSGDFSLNPDARLPCLTISSPGLSPATLLESPVFLSNPMVQPSPTTGKFSFFPGGSSNMLPPGPSDKTKDEFFDDIGASFTFQPISGSSSSFVPGGTTTKVTPVTQHPFPSTEMSIDYSNCIRSHTAEDIKPGSRNIETVNLHANFLGTSAERRKCGNDADPGEQRTPEATNIDGDLDDPQDDEQRRNVGDLVPGGAPAEDGYNWRKYGQKLVKGSEYPRSYYKCTHPNCLVKKKVERSREGHITEIIYKGAHNHPKPPPNRRSAIGSSGTGGLNMEIDGTDQAGQESGMGRDSEWVGTPQAGTNENAEEASPASAGFQYGNESGPVQVQGGSQYESGDAAAAAAVDASLTFSNDEDEDDRGTYGSVSLGYEGEGDETESKRRKLETYAVEMSGATRAIREPRVVVQTTSDVDILDDGYRWRKYGQKVVKGNPNPRSYYKCTAPGCTVRKHVERASHDLKSVITTYEGKHNHDVPAARNSNHGSAGGSGTIQAGSAAQTHIHQPQPRSRFERPVTGNAPFGHHPFSFQPQLGHPPPGFSFGLGQTGPLNLNLAMPRLAFGQGKLPSFPVHAYMGAPPLPQTVGDPGGMMLPRATEPKVEPMSETGLGLSESSSIYRQIMSRLPHI